MSTAKDILKELSTRKPTLLTRREVIELWRKQSETMLDTYCCPVCRDLMAEIEKSYVCKNMSCGNFGREYAKGV